MLTSVVSTGRLHNPIAETWLIASFDHGGLAYKRCLQACTPSRKPAPLLANPHPSQIRLTTGIRSE